MARRRLGQGGGIAAAVLGEIDVLRPERGRVRSGGPNPMFRFSPRAGQLWRFALGSNAAVLKKIGRGGTGTAKELRAQMDYLFSKSASTFGNAVAHDPNARSLSSGERKEIAADWSDGWTGAPKNGHTTHLLLSFPSHVRPEKARLIAEAWAFEMFQSGEHQDEEWAYVAALHTDRAHPHVHVVVNNRGLVNEGWFFMAKEHHFNLAMMKGRMVEIAAEEGVFLDATSRVERGILSYGPSRAEIERAREAGRAPVERLREGRALEDAMATVSRTATTMRGLAHLAALTGLEEVAGRIGVAEAALRRGGVVHPFPAGEARADRTDLERHFGTWLSDAAGKVAKQPAEVRADLSGELYGYAAEIARDLGDPRGAELMAMPPRSRLYGNAWADPERTAAMSTLMRGGAEIGIAPQKLVLRLASGAANAFEERSWLLADLIAVAGSSRFDLGKARDRERAFARLDGLLVQAAELSESGHGRDVAEGDEQLLRTLRIMAKVFPATGKVSFGSDDEAQGFAADLRERYGEGIARDLATGRTEALAGDFPERGERSAIAAAIVSAAKSHAGMGLTLREAERAERGVGWRRAAYDRELE